MAAASYPTSITDDISDLKARTKALEDRQAEDRADVRALKNLIIATLLAALGGAFIQIITLLHK